MDWELAIEKNHEALKRVLAMLVAMAGMVEPRGSAAAGAGDALTPPSVLPDISPSRGEISSSPTAPIADAEKQGPSAPLLISPLEGEMSGRTEGGAVEDSLPRAPVDAASPATLPRHLHRFVLRLLRPAEAAARRLIIIAARGIVVTLPKVYARKPSPKKPPLNRKNGYGTNIVIRPGPLPEWAKALVPKRSPRLSLALLDPMKRFGVRRKYAKPGAMPRIRVLGDYDPIVPFFRRPEPLPPPAPTPDDLLDAGSIHRRLDVLARALDDLPKQALRMARWQARRDARRERERAAQLSQFENTPSPSSPVATPSPSRPSGSPPLPHFMGARNGNCDGGAPAWHPFLAPTQWGRGGEGEARDGEGVKGRDGEGRAKERDGDEVNLAELGVTPEAIALLDRSRRAGRNAQPNITAQTPKPRRFHRMSPMRPGRPPGWRQRQNHEVYEVLTELHGLAVWASERRDSS